MYNIFLNNVAQLIDLITWCYKLWKKRIKEYNHWRRLLPNNFNSLLNYEMIKYRLWISQINSCHEKHILKMTCAQMNYYIVLLLLLKRIIINLQEYFPTRWKISQVALITKHRKALTFLHPSYFKQSIKKLLLTRILPCIESNNLLRTVRVQIAV